jgi:hypothetical protein
MATPTIYRSTDTSAPTLTGEASSLRLLLTAILVNGYGSQPAAGWTKPYEDAGTHLAAFRPGSGMRRYLYLNDAPTQISEMRALRTMTAITDVTTPFPLLTSVTVKFRKSITANNTARPWICLATDKHFYLISFGNQTVFGNYDGGDAHMGFGELVNPMVTGSKKTAFILGSFDTSTTSSVANNQRQSLLANTITQTGYCVLEGYPNQSPEPLVAVTVSATPFNETTSGGTTFPSYPDPSTGRLLLSRYLAQGLSLAFHAGYFPGVWCLCHHISFFNTGDTFSGHASSSLAGRTFLLIKTGAGAIVFETGGNW